MSWKQTYPDVRGVHETKHLPMYTPLPPLATLKFWSSLPHPTPPPTLPTHPHPQTTGTLSLQAMASAVLSTRNVLPFLSIFFYPVNLVLKAQLEGGHQRETFYEVPLTAPRLVTICLYASFPMSKAATGPSM